MSLSFLKTIPLALFALGAVACVSHSETGGDARTIADLESERPAEVVMVELAPPLAGIKTWIQGEPITDFELGKVYVVEFWATRCPPCLRIIPHMSELHRTYAEQGVEFIGLSGEEDDAIREFLATSGIDFSYSCVSHEDSLFYNWNRPVGNRGIPHAFIIDRSGIVVWHGHPAVIDAPLAQVVAGTFEVDH